RLQSAGPPRQTFPVHLGQPGTPLTPNATDRLYCGCLPRSAKCPALYGLVKAGIAHTSGRPSKSAEQSGTSCFKVPRSVHLTPGARHFMMCEFIGLAFKRTRLRKARAGWLRLCLEFLTGNFFLVSFHFSLIIVYHTSESGEAWIPVGLLSAGKLFSFHINFIQ